MRNITEKKTNKQKPLKRSALLLFMNIQVIMRRLQTPSRRGNRSPWNCQNDTCTQKGTMKQKTIWNQGMKNLGWVYKILVCILAMVALLLEV